MDLWFYENSLYLDGWRLICGVDEAGRGCLAGPVFAAAVILPPGLQIEGLNDSKKLTPQKRETLYDEIVCKAISYGIGTASHTEIDELNILNATYLAMNRAIRQLDLLPELALIDGNQAKGIEYLNKCIVGGDGKSASIAAASILAKVSRDRFMTEIAGEYPAYRFEQHKGYGTELHYEALRLTGPCAIHRRTFLTKMH
jgi:ribonuclease HII